MGTFISKVNETISKKQPLNNWECYFYGDILLDYSKKYFDKMFLYLVACITILEVIVGQSIGNNVKATLSHPVLKHGPRSITFRRE